MRLRFREEETTQAAARLIRSEGVHMNYMKLVKLLYLADRRALTVMGRPITFDSYISMDHGPVLSSTYDRINSEPPPEGFSYWHEHIVRRARYEVAVRSKEIPNDSLSPAEEGVLDEIYREYGEMDHWQLAEYTHTLPEWRDPKGSSLPIEISSILRSEGLSDDDIKEIYETLKGEQLAEQLLG